MTGVIRITLLTMLLLLGWSGWAYELPGPVPPVPGSTNAVAIFPLRFCTPLYEAEIDCQKHCLLRLSATVAGDQIRQPIPSHVSRRWWQDETLGLLTLETQDYTNSGMDRGHVFALLWASGSDDWQYANLTAAIVPQWPATNQGPIKNLEQRIADLAVEHGSVHVLIEIDYPASKLVRFPASDEQVGIPAAFRYRVQYGRRVEQYRIPNAKTADGDYRQFRLESP